MLRQQTGAEAQGLHASNDAQHCILRQGGATVPLVGDEVEGAVKAEGDEEVCPSGPALHPREAPAPARHAGGHEDAELYEEGGVSSPARLRHGEPDVRLRRSTTTS
jgi:hypothetical protein